MTSVGAILTSRPRECRHSGAFLARNGALPQFGAWCDTCGRWVTKELLWHAGLWLPQDHEKFTGIDMGAVPVRPHAWFRYCERCAKWRNCEMHHIAPRVFFGDECDDWPTLYLCRPCHEEWHAAVTPGLCTLYHPDRHAAMLFAYLGTDNVRRLYAALRDEGAKRKEAA